MGTPLTLLRSPLASPAFLSGSRFWNKSKSQHVFERGGVSAESEGEGAEWGDMISEGWQETKRWSMDGDHWPWRGRAVSGCSSANVRWHCLPPRPEQPAAPCDPPQEWRGGSRRSQYWGHYWPERRWRSGRRRVGGQDGKGWEGIKDGERWTGWKWVMIDSMNHSDADQREPGECGARGAETDAEEVMMNALGDVWW